MYSVNKHGHVMKKSGTVDHKGEAQLVPMVVMANGSVVHQPVDAPAKEGSRPAVPSDFDASLHIEGHSKPEPKKAESKKPEAPKS